jgi:hypothetical protein
MKTLLLLLSLIAALALPLGAQACPSCQTAAAAGSDDDDPLRDARAYNDSTLFMVAVPYGLLAFCGIGLFVLYRKKLREEARNESSDLPALTAAP